MSIASSFRCPTKFELLDQILALLPRGRAWQSNQGGPAPALDGAFDPGGFDEFSFTTLDKPGSVLWRFWAAFAEVSEFLHQRLCALRLEFWCATHSETNDLWMLEYGLPDPCDPFPDLCTKVAALGGTRCEYYAEVAARAGWTIECIEIDEDCGAQSGCAFIGDAMAGGHAHATDLVIRVHLDESEAFTLPLDAPSEAGCMLAGDPIACDPDISPLRCLLDRVVHAHMTIDYQPIGGI